MAEPNCVLSERAWLEQRYRWDRAPVATIAAEAGCDVVTVYRWLARHAIAPRGPAGRASLEGVSDAGVAKAVRRADTMTQAAAAMGVDLGTLRARLQAMGRLHRPDPGGLAAVIGERYRAGASREELAATYGVSVQTIRRRLLAAGVTPRRRGRPKSIPDSAPR